MLYICDFTVLLQKPAFIITSINKNRSVRLCDEVRALTVLKIFVFTAFKFYPAA